MSRCGPVVPVIDADDPVLYVRGACVVHCQYAPCPSDGEPAVPTAMHGDCVPSAEAATASWRVKTLGQRPFVLHMGRLSDLDRVGAVHHVDGFDWSCWCDPVIFAPVDAEQVP